MKHKFELKNENTLMLTIEVKAQNKAGDERVRIGWPTVKKLVEEYETDSKTTVVKCTTPSVSIDTGVGRNKNVWLFEIATPAKAKVVAPVKAKTTKTKTVKRASLQNKKEEK